MPDAMGSTSSALVVEPYRDAPGGDAFPAPPPPPLLAAVAEAAVVVPYRIMMYRITERCKSQKSFIQVISNYKALQIALYRYYYYDVRVALERQEQAGGS